MNTYRAQFMGEVPRGWDRLDTLARVVSIVSSLTIVDKTWSQHAGLHPHRGHCLPRTE
jgi:hypothetical protein